MLPTWRSLLAFAGMVGIGMWVAAGAWHPFLAVEEGFPAQGDPVDLLCVEGWSSESAIDAVAEAYRSGQFRRVAVTGGPTQSREKLIGFPTYAALGAYRLEQRGVPRDRIVVSEPAGVDRRRTLNDILELHRTLERQSIEPARMQIFSTGVHTRRTRLLYQRVFGGAVEIRAQALPPEDYDPRQWWSTSDGLKTVVMETISWVYDTVSPMPEIGREKTVNLTAQRS